MNSKHELETKTHAEIFVCPCMWCHRTLSTKWFYAISYWTQTIGMAYKSYFSISENAPGSLYALTFSVKVSNKSFYQPKEHVVDKRWGRSLRQS